MSLLKSITAVAVLNLAGGFAALVEAQPAPISDTVCFSIPTVAPESCTSFPEPSGDGRVIALPSLDGVSPTGNPAQYGNYTVLTEPDGTISDVFGVVPAVADLGSGVLGIEAFNFAFFSDTEIGGTTVPPEFINPAGGTPITLPEGNGGPFVITGYLSPVLVNEAGVTGTFTSDAERVPEPATLALLGIGLAGLGFSRRRRKR